MRPRRNETQNAKYALQNRALAPRSHRPEPQDRHLPEDLTYNAKQEGVKGGGMLTKASESWRATKGR